MWSVPDVNHVSGTDLDFVGAPSWTRTSDQRIMKLFKITVEISATTVGKYSLWAAVMQRES